ncbi:MAG TPA: hypothetical protein VGM98_21885 [Schlesneria sp.]|jgi:hypothetical protein
MRAARVIVELRDGRWIAYFGDELYTAVFGPDASQALLNLLATMGGGNFPESGLQPIDGATQEGHFEFLATFRAAPLPTQFGHNPPEFQGPGQS